MASFQTPQSPKCLKCDAPLTTPLEINRGYHDTCLNPDERKKLLNKEREKRIKSRTDKRIHHLFNPLSAASSSSGYATSTGSTHYTSTTTESDLAHGKKIGKTKKFFITF